MPSSPHIVSTGMSNRSISRRSIAIAHGAWTGVPNGTQDADPPVADLVLEPLDHDGAVVGHGAGGLGLLGQVLDEVAGRERIERVVRHQPLGGSRVVEVADLADERAERPAQLQRASGPVAVPERHLARLARRRA